MLNRFIEKGTKMLRGIMSLLLACICVFAACIVDSNALRGVMCVFCLVNFACAIVYLVRED